jgi:hypothetical protein
VADGDLLLAHVGVGSGNGVPTTPSGWTFLDSNAETNGDSYLYARLASSEPASYDWSVSSSSEYNVISHAYRPSTGSWADLGDAIAHVNLVVDKQSNTSQIVNEAVMPSGDMMLVTFTALGRGGTTTTQPTGYTMAGNPDSGGTTAAAVESGGAYKSVTAGTGPATNWTTTNSGTSTGGHFAIVDPGTDARTIRSYKFGSVSSGAAAASVSVKAGLTRSGDLMVALVGNRNGTASHTITPPAGYSSEGSSELNIGGDFEKYQVFTKVADGTEVGVNQTFTCPNAASWAVFLMALSDTTGSIGFVIANDTSANTTMDIPGTTMAAQSPHAIVLAVAYPERADSTPTATPSGYSTLRREQDSGGNNIVYWRSDAASGGALLTPTYKFETGSDPAATTMTQSGSVQSIGCRSGFAIVPAGGFFAYIIG